MDAFRTKTENVGAIERAKFRAQNQPAEWWASKLNTLYNNAGLDNPSSRNQEVIGEISRLLMGTQTPDGFTVSNVEVDGSTGRPMVVLKRTGEEPKRRDYISEQEYNDAVQQWRQSGEQKRIDLNVATLPTLGFTRQFTGQIGAAARDMGNFSAASQEFSATPSPVMEQRRTARVDNRRSRETGRSIVGEFALNNPGRELTNSQIENLRRQTREAGAELTEQEIRDEYRNVQSGAQPVEAPRPVQPRPQQPQQPQQGQEQQEQPRRAPVRWNPPSQ
jgi:hypothetical protein